MANYNLTAAEIMQTEVATVLGDISIQEAAVIMRYEGVRSLMVVPRAGQKQPGIITFSDIVHKVLAERLDPRRVLVDDVAVPIARTISPDLDVQSIARVFREGHFGHLPVMSSNGKLVGVVSMTDLITEVITEPD